MKKIMLGLGKAKLPSLETKTKKLKVGKTPKIGTFKQKIPRLKA